MRIGGALASVAALLCFAGIATADRAATKGEKRAIAKIFNVPPKCAKVRVATVTKRPKWASEQWKDGGSVCESVAGDGTAVLKKRDGRWRFVTAGSDFDCERLYRKVPRKVADDLGLACRESAPRVATAKAQCGATFQVLHNDRIGQLRVPAGHYTVTLLNSRLTCARASRLFARFLQDFDGALPGSWRLNVAKQRFRNNRGLGFSVRRVSGGPGGGGAHPGGVHTKCPTFRVLNDDRIGSVRFPAGTYAMTALGGFTCQQSSSSFARFLQRFQGNLPGGWRLDGATGTFSKGGSSLGFQVNFRR